jgi:hypothetical protein
MASKIWQGSLLRRRYSYNCRNYIRVLDILLEAGKLTKGPYKFTGMSWVHIYINTIKKLLGMYT